MLQFSVKSIPLNALAIKPLSLAVVATLTLTACSNSSNHSSKNSNTNPNNANNSTPINPVTPINPTPVPTPVPTPTIPKTPKALTPAERIAKAQQSGNSSDVVANWATDESVLLQQLVQAINTQQTYLDKVVKSILSENSKPLDLQFKGMTDSNTLRASDPFVSRDILTSDTGVPISTLSVKNDSRFLGYGIDILAKVGISHQNHAPMLQRGINWLILGDADKNLSQNQPLTIAYVGYKDTVIKNYFKNTYDITPTLIACDLFSENNTCWQSADLLIIGSGHANISDQRLLERLFNQYQTAKKPLLYVGGGWWANNDGRENFLRQYGIDLQGYAGNYFASPANLTSSSNNRLDNVLTFSEKLAGLANLLTNLNNGNPFDKAGYEQAKNSIQHIQTFFNQQNQIGHSVFSQNSTIGKNLALLADGWRKNAVYDGFDMNDETLYRRTLMTLIADKWVDYKRPMSIAPSEGAGDYMPKTANDLAVSSDWETITLTLPQGNGITAIGRAVIPAKTAQIQVVNADKANLNIQTGYIRTVAEKDNKYKRPAKPNSVSVPINDTVTDFNSPFGGVLMLNYNNATAGQTVTLKVKGVAKYAHFDFTKAMSQGEIDEASQALRQNLFGWSTIKLIGGEIQQLNSKALNSIGNRTPQQYTEQIKAVIFDSNHIANGYNNMPIDASTQTYCNQLGWDCMGKIHNPPNVQHMVGWLPACGALCSGHPIDAYYGVDTGWGWVHELGHNTVQRVLSMTFKSSETGETIGCGVECDNNILSGLSMLRKNELYQQNNNGRNFAHWALLSQIHESRNTGKTGEALRLDMEKRLWSGNGYTNPNAKQAVTMQLAMLYTKHKQAKALPDSQGIFEFFRLLNTANRLVNQIDWKTANAEEKAKYGLGAYSDKDFSTPELVYMLSSKIVGKDLKDVFNLYGLPISDKAKSSVAMLNLPVAPLDFYNQTKDRNNFLQEGQWINL
ncbi:ImpA family metalloprotease [Moraxella boevrei]|uniref:ImpA family metalloprotease n=1 Tax=Faucicola boevrei TaxID=346665 RepID=UPI0037363847